MAWANKRRCQMLSIDVTPTFDLHGTNISARPKSTHGAACSAWGTAGCGHTLLRSGPPER